MFAFPITLKSLLFILEGREEEKNVYKFIDQLKSQSNIFNVFYHTHLKSVKHGHSKNAYNW